MSPREISIIERCSFKAHPCQNCGKAKTNPAHRKKGGTCVYKRKNGCAECGKPKGHRDHMGAVPTLNSNIMRNPLMFNQMKEQWEELFLLHLGMADLPDTMQSVSVSAKLIFPDLRHRDEGNLRFLLEKCMGDALQKGGWISDDCFYPVRKYTFGQLEGEHRPGVNGVVLTIWPEG